MENNPFVLFLTLAPRTDPSLTHTKTADTTFLNEFNSPSVVFTSAPNHLNLMEEILGLTENQTQRLCEVPLILQPCIWAFFILSHFPSRNK